MKRFIGWLSVVVAMASVNLLTTQTAEAVDFTINFDNLPSQGATNQSLDFATGHL